MHHRWRTLATALAAVVLLTASAEARAPHKPHKTRAPRPTATPTPPPTAANALLKPAGTIPLPGRGMALAWAPDGAMMAAGGHFKDKATGQRYDTRILDVASRTLTPRSFDCHHWWVVAVTWNDNPFLGELIIDGGGDHAVKIWNADGRGSRSCDPGQFRAEHGGLASLYDINGWITSLDVSPDGRFLAGASRDRAVRIWQLAPGPNQFKVVRLWYDAGAKNLLSVRWSPDGTRLATGDRRGRIAEWSFDPATDLWDDATIAKFSKVSWKGHPAWFTANPALVTRTPLWTDDGHKQVWNVRYASDGSAVAGVGADGVLSVLASGSGSVRYRVRAPRTTAFHGLDWSPDGAVIAAGGADESIHLFDAATGAVLDRLEGHGETVTAVAWSPDGSMLASTAGGPLINLALNQVVKGPDDAIHLWTWR